MRHLFGRLLAVERGDLAHDLLARRLRARTAIEQGDHLLAHGRIQVLFGNYLVDQPDLARPAGGYALAGEKQRPRQRGSDLRDHERRDGGGRDAEPHLREREPRPLGGDHYVARRHQPDATPDGRPLHPSDDRLLATVNTLEHRRQRPSVGDVLLVGKSRSVVHVRDVRPGAERASLSREHHDPHGVIGGKILEAACKLADKIGIQRIVRVGPGKLHGRHRTLDHPPNLPVTFIHRAILSVLRLQGDPTQRTVARSRKRRSARWPEYSGSGIFEARESGRLLVCGT